MPIGYKHTEEARRKISEASKGNQYATGNRFWLGKKRPGIGGVKKGTTPWNKGKNLSPSHCENLVKSHLGIKMPSRTIQHRSRLAEANRGARSHLWKGGISEENKRIRASIDIRLWREAVFARDNFTCQECKKRGGELHSHHIKPFALFPELRFAIDNGLTLCVSCHKKTDSYGIRLN